MKFDDIRVGDRLRVEKEFTVTEISDDAYVWSGYSIFTSREAMDKGVDKVTLLERTAKYQSIYLVWLNPVDPPVYAFLRRGADGDVFVYGDPEELNRVTHTFLAQVERYEVVQ